MLMDVLSPLEAVSVDSVVAVPVSAGDAVPVFEAVFQQPLNMPSAIAAVNEMENSLFKVLFFIPCVLL